MAFTDQRDRWVVNRVFVSKGKSSFSSPTRLFGPVRKITERIGETINLVGDSQMRSLAALLAKKHACARHPMSKFHELAKRRELTEKECLEIFEIMKFKRGES